MDRTEFIYGLRRALSDIEDYDFVNDTIAYYENYIDTQIRKGTPEDQVLEQLGDPRYIAKSIKASRGVDGEGYSSSQSDDYENVIYDSKRYYNINGKQFSLPVWLDSLIRIILAVVAIIFVFAVAKFLLPVVIVGIAAIVVYRFIKENFF